MSAWDSKYVEGWDPKFKEMMPRENEIPLKWRRVDWNRYERNLGPRHHCLLYLHDPGCPFLRFYVYHPSRSLVPCPKCHGTGRVERPAREPVIEFFNTVDFDPVDENGLRRCLTCNGRKTVSAIFGYGDIDYRPFWDDTVNIAPPKCKADVLETILWCDMLFEKLRNGMHDLERLAIGF